MAILQIQKPTAKQETREPSTLDKLLGIVGTGLGIANSAYGIKTEIQQAKLAKIMQDLAPKESAAKIAASSAQAKAAGSQANLTDVQRKRLTGEINPTEPELISQGFQPSDEGVPLQVSSMGEQVTKTFKTPLQIQKELDEEKFESNQLIALLKSKDEAAKQASKEANALRREYNGSSITGKTEDMLSSFNKLKNSYNEPDSGINHLSMIIGFAKMIDPGSVVREGEVWTIKKADSLPGFLVSEFNRLTSQDGAMLSPQNKKRIIIESAALMRGQLTAQQKVNERYEFLANRKEIDPSLVINEFDQNELFSGMPGSTSEMVSQQADQRPVQGPSLPPVFNQAIAVPGQKPFDINEYKRKAKQKGF